MTVAVRYAKDLSQLLEWKEAADEVCADTAYDADKGGIYRPGCIAESMQRLRDYGITFGEGYHSVSKAAQGILVAEAVNWAAKTLDDSFYDRKADVVVAAAVEGAAEGVILQRSSDDYGNRVYDLYHPEVGVASFHDRDGVIDELLQDQQYKVHLVEDSFPWCEISRQATAFELLENTSLLNRMALATEPQWNNGKPPAKCFTERVAESRPVPLYTSSSSGWNERIGNIATLRSR